MATPPTSPSGGGGSTPDPKKIQQLADLLEKVDGYSASTARSMANAAAQAGVLDAELTKVAKRQQDLNKGFQSLVDSIKDSVKEITKLNTESGKINNSFNELDSIASRVLRSKKDIKNASSEELKNIQKTTEYKKFHADCMKTVAPYVFPIKKYFGKDKISNTRMINPIAIPIICSFVIFILIIVLVERLF